MVGYLCADGFPLFYAWDVTEGKSIPIAEEKILIPETIKVELDKLSGQIRNLIIEQYKHVLLFSGSLFWKVFGAVTTSDTPVHSGPCLVEVYQKNEDLQRFRNLTSTKNGDKVKEFRAITEKSKNCIPLLRARRPEADFGEVYPIAAVPYGDGYLLTCGMKIEDENEKQKTLLSVDRFIEWLQKR